MHMEIYSRFLTARDLSEVLLEQHILEREANIGGANACADSADRQFQKLAERMGYRVERVPAVRAA